MCCHVLLNDNECQILLPSKSPEVWSMFHLSNILELCVTSMSAISLYWHAVAISTVLWLPSAPLFLKGWRWHEDAQDLCKTLGCPATHICCWVAHQGISTHCSCAILQATTWHLEGSSEGRKVGGIKWDGPIAKSPSDHIWFTTHDPQFCSTVSCTQGPFCVWIVSVITWVGHTCSDMRK